MTTRIMLCLALLGMGIKAIAQHQDDPRKYFFYDKSCMKKYEYQPEGGFNGQAFIDFHLPLSKTKTVVFRVELDKRFVTKMAPGDFSHELLDCDNLNKALSPEYLADVHNSLQLAFVLESDKNGHSTLYQVKETYSLEINSEGLTWKNPLAGFSYNKQNTSTNSNLYQDGNKGGKVFWAGPSPAQACLNTFSFKQISNFNEIPQMSLYFVENVGLLSMRSDKGGSMELKNINGRPINEYMEKVCKIRAYNEAKKNNANKPVSPKSETTKPKVYDPLDPNNTENGVVKTEPRPFPSGEFTSRGEGANLQPGGIYIVEEGDNLYKIAQKFNTSVDELLRINQLKTANLNRNQKLKIIDDGSAPAEQSNPIYIEDPIARQRKKVHVVHQGENLGSIARKYGIKIADIYRFNELQSDFIDINQRLVVGIEQLP